VPHRLHGRDCRVTSNLNFSLWVTLKRFEPLRQHR